MRARETPLRSSRAVSWFQIGIGEERRSSRRPSRSSTSEQPQVGVSRREPHREPLSSKGMTSRISHLCFGRLCRLPQRCVTRESKRAVAPEEERELDGSGPSLFSFLLMAPINRCCAPLCRAFRALSHHPPIAHRASLLSSRPTPSHLHLSNYSTSSPRARSARSPWDSEPLAEHQHLYSIGYPTESFDDSTPPLVYSQSQMALPPPLTSIAIGDETQSYSMTNKSIVYTCTR